MKRNLLLISLLAVVFACSSPLPALVGIDMVAWKTDKKGCNGVRAGTVNQIVQQRHKLEGLSEMDIIEILGRPDEYNLYKRHQKFYSYWLEPGKLCGRDLEPKKLTVRFNATGAAKEIAVE